MQRILILQRKAVRFLSNFHYRESCIYTFNKLKMLTIVNLYILETVIIVLIKAPETMESCGKFIGIIPDMQPTTSCQCIVTPELRINQATLVLNSEMHYLKSWR